MSNYVVSAGQNIYDCLLCIAGDIQQLDKFLEINNINTYTPQLNVGDQLDTTGIKKSNNDALLRAEKYPFSNGSYSYDTAILDSMDYVWITLDSLNSATQTNKENYGWRI